MIDQQPYIAYRLIDDSNTLTTLRYHVRRGLAVAAAHSAADLLRGRLRGCSGLSFLEQTFVLPGVELFPANASFGADARFCGVFVFSTNAPHQYAILVVPGLWPGLLVQSGLAANLDIDTQQPAVAALIAELTSGRWCNRSGHTITALEAAYMQVRDAVFIPDWI